MSDRPYGRSYNDSKGPQPSPEQNPYSRNVRSGSPAQDAKSYYDRSRYGSGASRSAGDRAHGNRTAAHSRHSRPAAGASQKTAPSPFKQWILQHKAAVIAIAAVLCLGLGSAFAYAANITGALHRGIDQDLRNTLVKTDMAKEPFYLLLLGTDGSAERDESGVLDGVYRSDSMMLARIDAVNKKATLVSIGRDTTVNLPGYGEQKINAAYGFGGPAMAVKAVSELAGVPISHYAQVDFDGFSSLVDALGGVEVEVPVAIDDWEAGGSVDAGLQTLDGEKALILCRSRNTYADTAAHPDEMRAANQRLVLSAIARKLLESDIVTIAGSVQSMAQFVSTDLEITDIIGLAQAMQGIDTQSSIYTAQAPTNSQYINETWYEYIDQKAWTAMMERVKAGLPPTEESQVDETTGTVVASAGKTADLSTGTKYASITVKNGTDHQGQASKTRQQLVDAGFKNVVIGDIAEGYDYPETLIVYGDEAMAYEAEQIAQIIGQGTPFLNDGSYLVPEEDFLVLIGDDWTVSS